MIVRSLVFRLAFGALVSALPTAVRAQTPDAAQASALQTQIRDWLAGVLGPRIPLGDRPVRVEPAHDHYRLLLDVPLRLGGLSLQGGPMTADIRPLDGARWQVDDLHFPSPLRMENAGAKKDEMRRSTAEFGQQTAYGVVDPTLATGSTFDSQTEGYRSKTEQANGASSTTRWDRLVSHTEWQPRPDGRLDIRSRGTGENLGIIGAANSGGEWFSLAATGFAATGALDQVSLPALGAAIRAIADVATAVQAAESKTGSAKNMKSLPPAARAPLHAALVALRDTASRLEEEFTLQNAGISVLGHAATLASIGSTFSLGAADGRAEFRTGFVADGIDTAEIPPGPLHDLLPRHLALRPHLSGIPVDALFAFLLRAADTEEPGAIEAEALRLLAQGPLSIGLDELAIDAGPAGLRGSGSVAIASPDDIAATATLRATGLDALLRQTTSVPMLQQAAPVLIFLKGISRQDGEAAVWDIAFHGGKLTVNDTDLSALVPGGQKP